MEDDIEWRQSSGEQTGHSSFPPGGGGAGAGAGAAARSDDAFSSSGSEYSEDLSPLEDEEPPKQRRNPNNFAPRRGSPVETDEVVVLVDDEVLDDEVLDGEVVMDVTVEAEEIDPNLVKEDSASPESDAMRSHTAYDAHDEGSSPNDDDDQNPSPESADHSNAEDSRQEQPNRSGTSFASSLVGLNIQSNKPESHYHQTSGVSSPEENNGSDQPRSDSYPIRSDNEKEIPDYFDQASIDESGRLSMASVRKRVSVEQGGDDDALGLGMDMEEDESLANSNEIHEELFANESIAPDKQPSVELSNKDDVSSLGNPEEHASLGSSSTDNDQSVVEVEVFESEPTSFFEETAVATRVLPTTQPTTNKRRESARERGHQLKAEMDRTLATASQDVQDILASMVTNLKQPPPPLKLKLPPPESTVLVPRTTATHKKPAEEVEQPAEEELLQGSKYIPDRVSPLPMPVFDVKSKSQPLAGQNKKESKEEIPNTAPPDEEGESELEKFEKRIVTGIDKLEQELEKALEAASSAQISAASESVEKIERDIESAKKESLPSGKSTMDVESIRVRLEHVERNLELAEEAKREQDMLDQLRSRIEHVEMELLAAEEADREQQRIEAIAHRISQVENELRSIEQNAKEQEDVLQLKLAKVENELEQQSSLSQDQRVYDDLMDRIAKVEGTLIAARKSAMEQKEASDRASSEVKERLSERQIAGRQALQQLLARLEAAETKLTVAKKATKRQSPKHLLSLDSHALRVDDAVAAESKIGVNDRTIGSIDRTRNVEPLNRALFLEKDDTQSGRFGKAPSVIPSEGGSSEEPFDERNARARGGQSVDDIDKPLKVKKKAKGVTNAQDKAKTLELSKRIGGLGSDKYVEEVRLPSPLMSYRGPTSQTKAVEDSAVDSSSSKKKTLKKKKKVVTDTEGIQAPRRPLRRVKPNGLHQPSEEKNKPISKKLGLNRSIAPISKEEKPLQAEEPYKARGTPMVAEPQDMVIETQEVDSKKKPKKTKVTRKTKSKKKKKNEYPFDESVSKDEVSGSFETPSDEESSKQRTVLPTAKRNNLSHIQTPTVQINRSIPRMDPAPQALQYRQKLDPTIHISPDRQKKDPKEQTLQNRRADPTSHIENHDLTTTLNRGTHSYSPSQPVVSANVSRRSADPPLQQRVDPPTKHNIDLETTQSVEPAPRKLSSDPPPASPPLVERGGFDPPSSEASINNISASSIQGMHVDHEGTASRPHETDNVNRDLPLQSQNDVVPPDDSNSQKPEPPQISSEATDKRESNETREARMKQEPKDDDNTGSPPASDDAIAPTLKDVALQTSFLDLERGLPVEVNTNEDPVQKHDDDKDDDAKQVSDVEKKDPAEKDDFQTDVLSIESEFGRAHLDRTFVEPSVEKETESLVMLRWTALILLLAVTILSIIAVMVIGLSSDEETPSTSPPLEFRNRSNSPQTTPLPTRVPVAQGSFVPPPPTASPFIQDIYCPAVISTVALPIDGSTVQGSTFGSMYGALGLDVCGDLISNGDDGVWYYMVGQGAIVNAYTCTVFFPTFDTKISIYTPIGSSCANGLACVAANDDFCGMQSRVSWLAEANRVYYIYVHGKYDIEKDEMISGDFSLTLDTPAVGSCAGGASVIPQPSSDANVIEILEGTLSGGSFANDPCGPETVNRIGELWYSVVGTGGWVEAATCHAASEFPARLAVYSGSCDELVCVSASDVDCGSGSAIRWFTNPGETYYLLVYTTEYFPSLDFGLSVEAVPL